MTYDEIHPAMREALGAFEVLRRFGFKSEDIFFHQNADEPPGPEPFGMMFVVLKTRGKSFSIRVGVVDLPYAAWADGWKAVATAALEERIEQNRPHRRGERGVPGESAADDGDRCKGDRRPGHAEAPVMTDNKERP